jgi:PST family polysaccharide transporter
VQQVGEPRDGAPASAEARAAAAPTRAASLLSKAVRGAFWMVLSGSGARVLGIVGTLAVTRYLNPEDYGEVSLAMLVMQITHMLANSGLSQYIASRPKAGRDVVFHATFFYTLFGVVALLLTLLFGARIGASLHAPGIVRYLPGLALAVFLERFAVIQDRIQLRNLQFRSVGLQRSLGELVYSGVSVGLAAFASGTPYGGAAALVWASLARSGLRVITLGATTPWREWIEPHKITWATTRELFVFGLPMAVVTLAGYGAQKFDNLIFQYHFGLAWLTFYNLAYNFADMPAALIGEQIGDVLVPSFAHMEDDEKRKDALLLSIRMMILLVTPLAVGLVAVAPTLSKVAFDARYQEGIIKVLQLLSLFSMARTITWVGNSYLQVRNQPRTIMMLETGRMIGIVVFMNAFVFLGLLQGPGHAVRWACAAVVFVFTGSALSYMVAIRQLDGVSLRAQILPLIPPMIATIPMGLAVVGARRVMTKLALFALDHPRVTSADNAREFGPRLVVEIIVGAIVFVPAALLIAPSASRELLTLVKNAIQRRRQGPSGDGAPGEAPAAS